MNFNCTLRFAFYFFMIRVNWYLIHFFLYKSMKNNNKIIGCYQKIVFGSIQLILVEKVKEQEAIHARARHFIHVFFQCRSCDDEVLFGFSNSSKYLRALRMLIRAASDGIVGSDMMTMIYVLLVNVLMNAAN